MMIRPTWYLPALLLALWAPPSEAAQSVHADRIVHVTRTRPTHRFVQVERMFIPYGTTPDSLGFSPQGSERVAVGPAAFDVDDQGAIVVADPIRAKVFLVHDGASTPTLSPLGDLPLPFSDIAVDRDGKVFVADLGSRSVVALGEHARMRVEGQTHAMRFIRHGRALIVQSGRIRKLLRHGALSSWASDRIEVEKCNAEAGLVTFGASGKKIQVEIGGPLASMSLIGVSVRGDTFLAVEQFRQRGRLEVDRRVIVLDAQGTLKATLETTERAVVHPERDFALGPRGELVRMIPGNQGVAFVRWEVR